MQHGFSLRVSEILSSRMTQPARIRFSPDFRLISSVIWTDAHLPYCKPPEQLLASRVFRTRDANAGRSEHESKISDRPEFESPQQNPAGEHVGDLFVMAMLPRAQLMLLARRVDVRW